MLSYAEKTCQPIRDDLKRTETLFCEASGEFQRRAERKPYVHHTYDRTLDLVYGQQLDLGDLGSRALDSYEGTDEISPFVALSRRYLEAHNRRDLEGLMVLVDDDVEFKRAFDPPLIGKEAVLSHYEQDWVHHKGEILIIGEFFEAEGKVAIEIHVDSGPPSNLRYDGMVVNHWNDEGRLALYHLYVDEVTSAEERS
jgi:ketosteroid isomerase-like protein